MQSSLAHQSSDPDLVQKDRDYEVVQSTDPEEPNSPGCGLTALAALQDRRPNKARPPRTTPLTLPRSGDRTGRSMDRSNESPEPENDDDHISRSSSRASSQGVPSNAEGLKSHLPPHSSEIAQMYEHNMDDLQFRLSNEFTALSEDKADTIVYIGPPARSPGQSQIEYEHTKAHFASLHQVRSINLRSLSSSVFDRLLRPNASIRAEKRLKKLGVLKSIDTNSIQYHIDLRPPSEDEEAIILLTDLTCSQGILKWHLAIDKYKISRRLVLGTDELDGESNPYFQTRIRPAPKTMLEIVSERKGKKKRWSELQAETAGKTSEREGLVEMKPLSSNITIPKEVVPTKKVMERIPPEYLSLRHHSAIERLLNAICGNDPILDSAPKMWTYFAIAKYFGCARVHKVNKWITAWIYEKSNVNFIQNNPEVTYRIGMDIESPEMVRVAFSLLVGERAMANVHREVNGSTVQPVTSAHGRMYEYLDDDEWNRIDHAASSLAYRIHMLFDSIVVHMDWLRQSVEYRRIDDIVPRSLTEHKYLTDFKTLLRDYVRGRILAIIAEDMRSVFSDHDPCANQCAVFQRGPMPSLEDVYNRLELPARKFTRTFWLALQRNIFESGDANTSFESALESKHNPTSLEHLIDAYATDPYNGILRIHVSRLRTESFPVNGIIMSHDQQDHRHVSRQDFTVWPTQLNPPLHDIVNTAMKEDSSVENYVSPLLSSPKRVSDDSHMHASLSEKRRRTVTFNDQRDLPLRPIRLVEATDAGSTQTQKASPSITNSESVRKAFEKWQTAEQDMETQAGPGSANQPGSSFSEDKPSLSGVPIEKAAPPEIWPDAHLTASVPDQRTSPNNSENIGLKLEQIPELIPRVKFEDVSSTDGIFNFEPPIEESAPNGTAPRQAALRTPAGYMNKEDVGQLRADRAASVTTAMHAYQEQRAKVAQGPGFIELETMLRQFSVILSRKCEDVIYPPHLFHSDIRVPIDLVDFLVCLEDDEWKYLPLWAGGCDDGTGGVFDEVDVPNLEAGGFRGGKRGIITSKNNGKGKTTGDQDASISGTESSFEELNSEDALSTVGRASKFATDGTRTVKSVSDATSESDFMNQDEIYEQIQAMKMEEARKGKRRANDDTHIVTVSNHQGLIVMNDSSGADLANDGTDIDGDEADDISTVMGAGSDTHGDMFHDIDDDENEHSFDNGDNNGEVNINDDDEDDDDEEMEIIDKNDL